MRFTKLRTLLILMCLAISIIPIGIIGGIQGYESQSWFLIGLIFIVTLCVSFIISYFITRPIEKLTKNIDQISKGRFDIDLEYSEISEINTLTESLDRVMASLKLAIVKVGVKKGEIFESPPQATGEIQTDKVNISEKLETQKEPIDEKWSEKEFDAVFIFDEKANILDCDENMYNLLGYTKEEILKMNLGDIDTLETKKDLEEKIKKVKDEGSINFKTFHKKKDGGYLPVFESLEYDKDKKQFKGIIREDDSLKKADK